MFLDERRKKIGENIKKIRTSQKPKMSQKNFLLEINMSSDSVSSLRKWENGEMFPSTEILARICEVFGCDFGYLIGDYEERDYSSSQIRKYTGLSETAISRIHSANIDLAESVTALRALNDLLSSELFWDMLSDLDAYRYH